ncbi:MAG: carotenoid biosynthesis protein [Chloroflexi bacterium]|nr:carotenoid biosynthesis protein [Chloroflexota bacterium]
MVNPAYAFLEASVVVLFVIACLHAWRRGSLLEILTAAVYGLLLEEGDILIFGTYHYSPDFILRIDMVPVAIALAWAMIIYTCMRISDTFGISTRMAPIADAVWAIMLDLAFDAVAIRLGFWTWTIPLDAGFFGVPAGNFYAWLFVALSFSFFTRAIRRQSRLRAVHRFWQLAVPIVAYIGMLLALVPFFVIRNSFFPEPGGGLPVFWAVLSLFVIAVAWEMVRHKTALAVRLDWLPIILRTSFHLYFLGSLFTSGIFTTLPALLAISLGIMALEVALTLVLWSRCQSTKNIARQTAA